jgi:hypothetical protein
MRIYDYNKNSLQIKDNLERVAYIRFNGVTANLIGELQKDKDGYLYDLLKAFNDKSEELEISEEFQKIDEYLGSLGLDREYGHKDINYGRRI